jgi:hypothetical protein
LAVCICSKIENVHCIEFSFWTSVSLNLAMQASNTQDMCGKKIITVSNYMYFLKHIFPEMGKIELLLKCIIRIEPGYVRFLSL